VVGSVVSDRPYRAVRFWSEDLARQVTHLVEFQGFDVVVVSFLTMVGYLEPWLSGRAGTRHRSRPLLVLDQHNVDAVVWKRHVARSKNPVRRLYSAWQLRRVRSLQETWYPRFDLILSVSDADRALTAHYVDETSTQVLLVPNGVDTALFNPGVCRRTADSDKPILVYGGSMDVRMNQDAVAWFVDKILPLIRLQIPEVLFRVVGRRPPRWIRQLSDLPGVTVTGTVADVRPHYCEAEVFVVPSRMGGGTKLKVLEAMALARPVVSTAIGAQGLDVVDGEHVYIADDAAQFAKRVVELLRDRGKASAVGGAAAGLVRTRYTWDRIISPVEEILTQLATRESGG
jgi:glycosyltransferase involved in cell wall biosynthesis